MFERLRSLLAKKKPTQEPDEPSGRYTGGSRENRDIPIIALPEWNTVNAIRTAILQLTQGNFRMAALLADAIAGDDHVKGVFTARFDGLLGLPLTFQPPRGQEENALALKITEACEIAWPKMCPESEVGRILRYGRLLGFGLGEKVWQTGDQWIPQLKMWHPANCFWRWDLREFALLSQEGQVVLDREIPEIARQWLVFTPSGKQYGWNEGLVRPLAVPWIGRQWTVRDWARYDEVHGMPIRGGVVPMEASDADKERFLRELAMLAQESVIRLPRGEPGNEFDVKLIEAAATGWETFKGFINDYANPAISIAVLGQNLTTQVRGGSLAAARVHDNVRNDILRADADQLSSCLREQLLVDFVAANYGEAAVALTPWPKWAADQPEDQGAKATAFNTFAQGLAKIRTAQVPIDIAQICEEHGIPLLEGVEIPDFEPPAPPQLPGKGGDEEPGDKGKDGDEKLSRVDLSRRRKAPVQAQQYVDQVIDHAREAAAQVLASDVRTLRKVINEATSYEDLKARLLAAYHEMAPDALAHLTRKVDVMAQLSGRYAVAKELSR